MQLITALAERWAGVNYPFLIHADGEITFSDILSQKSANLDKVKSGDVVALIGDIDPQSISTMLNLIDRNVILVPLTAETRSQHDYFFESALVDIVIEGDSIKRIHHNRKHDLINQLRQDQHAGLVFFSTGTTGRPKAILHDLRLFLRGLQEPRPTRRVINFLLFDHIGGLNTLFHTLFNKGTVVAPKSRNVEDILKSCEQHKVEVLPTTPTFLRMMLISGLIPDRVPSSLKTIKYGSERMDQPTLDALCKMLPNVDIKQVFGMSELGTIRVKSEAKNSIFMKLSGEGVETRIVDGVLEIRSTDRMLGYLNAPNPFDKDGWFHTKDLVEKRNGYYKIIGRTTEAINVGGIKFMVSEVERAALEFEGVALAKAEGKPNPITGQHVELIVQPKPNYEINKQQLKKFLSSKLSSYMLPKKFTIGLIAIGHRFKKK